MLAADQRNALAEALPVLLDQDGAVVLLLRGHLVEDGGRMRIVVAQPVGIGAIDAPVVLFRGDGQRQHFLFGQRIEGAAAEAEDARQHLGIPQFRTVQNWN